MPRLSIMPFNDMGEPVKRGISTIDSKATREQIASKVFYTADKAGMGKIVSCDVTHQDGTHISTWDLREDGQVAVQCDGEGSLEFENSVFMKGTLTMEPNTEANAEDAVAADLAAKKAAAEELKAKKIADAEAKKAEREKLAADKKAQAEAKKAEREAAAAAKKAAKPAKGPTKKDRVHALMQTETGVSVEQIAAALEVGEVAARSLINDVKRAGKTVTAVKNEVDKKTYFKSPVEAAAESTETAESPAAEADAA